MNNALRNVTIIGTGSYIPSEVRTNKYFENLGTSDEWIYNTLGIKERHIAAEDEATSDLAAKAGLKAIEDANISVDDIDLIIVATATPDRPAPATACFVQDKIKAHNAAAFDMLAVCAGFMYGMSIASQYIASGTFDNILVIGADTFSRITDWERRDSVFFGDGAGAAVLSHTDKDSGFLAYRICSDGRGKYGFTIPGGGSEKPISTKLIDDRLQYWHMNGKEVYNAATKVVPEVIKQVLDDTGLKPEDIDWVIPHQPGKGMLKKMMELAGIPWEKVMTNMDKYANTSGGTVPIMLDETNKAGKIKKGDIVLFASVGAGWTWSAGIMKWSK
jgi:3-oxoacyl-[acyl-carrier-protein] synthase III